MTSRRDHNADRSIRSPSTPAAIPAAGPPIHSAPAAFPTAGPPSCTGTTASLPVGPNPPTAKPGTRPAALRRSTPPMPRPNPTAPGVLERRSGPSPAHRRAAVPLAVDPRLQLNQVNPREIQPPQHVQIIPGPNASLSKVGHKRTCREAINPYMYNGLPLIPTILSWPRNVHLFMMSRPTTSNKT